MLRLPPLQPPPLLAAGRIDRRTLLKLAGVSGLAVAGAGWAFKALRGFGPATAGFFVLDELEADVVRQLAIAAFPGPPEWPLSADEVGVAAFVDLYVSQLYPDLQELLRTLIRAVNASTLATHGSTMRRLPVAERLSAWKAWSVSSIAVRRAAYQSLTFAMHLGYFEDDRVREAAGFTRGCVLPDAASRPDLWTMVGGRRG